MKRARSPSIVIPSSIISSLAKMQDSLNKFINENWRAARCADDWGLAVTMESTELMDSYPWKWWKNINATPDFKNIRVELVDILHFTLSGTMQIEGTTLAAIPEDIDQVITTPLSETKNAIRTFRNVIYLAKLHRFDIITQVVIAAAEDLEFNLVGYYVAKHTLNYIRQLGGYKDGSYVKVRQGQEDNELLHQCIAEVVVTEVLGEETHEAAWNLIMAKVYEAFNVDVKDRRVKGDWCK
jgi:dUTP pyrophosphatase